MLNRIYTLTLSIVLYGLLRAVGSLALDRHWAAGLHRLAAETIHDALIGPDLLVRGAIAAAIALVVSAIVGRVVAPWIRSPERRDAAGSVAMIAAFWGAAAMAEVANRTALRDVMTTRIDWTPAQVQILSVALLGAAVSLLIVYRFGKMQALRAGVATAAILASWLALAQGARALATRWAPGAETSRPNVVLITIDTLRADHLSAYGYARKTSPRIDELAGRGILFERAIAHAPNTHPSTAALITSRYPSDLGGNPYKYIPYSDITLAEAFLDAGYATAAIVSNVWLKSSMGFDQGFEHFDETSAISEFYADGARVDWKIAADVTDAGLGWLDERRPGPFFLWLHYLDPHHPYDPPEEFLDLFSTSARDHADFLARLDALPTGEQTRTLTGMGRGEIAVSDEEFQAIVDQYDREIAYTDFEVGRVVDRLNELGIGDTTTIALTADHGEEFRDHGGWGHSHTLHQELLHVPLVIAPAGQTEGWRVATPVRLLDVAPTLLAHAGVAIPSGMRGVDLAAKPDLEHPAVSMLTRKDELAIQWQGWKLVTDVDRSNVRLYDLENDSHERIDLARAESKRVEMMLALLEAETGQGARAERMDATATQLDASTRKQLEALGYLD